MSNIAILHTAESLVVPAALPKLDHNRHRLLACHDRLVEGYKIDRSSKLLPLAELHAMAEEIDNAATACGKDFAARWVAYLIGCYPNQKGQECKIYVRSVICDLAEFPADIVEQTFHAITRTSKFLPSRAEVLAEAKALLGKRTAMKFVIERQIEEHGRRKAAIEGENKPSRWADLPESERQAMQAKLDAIKAMAGGTTGAGFASEPVAMQPQPEPELTDGLSPDQLKAYWLARLDNKTPQQARLHAKGDA